MANNTPDALAERLSGLLAFPLTPYSSDGAVDLQRLRDEIDRLLSYGAAGIFPACGTGELQSLSAREHADIIRITVEHVAGRVPVVAACGFGLGQAVEMARHAERVGADGVLAFPPYLSGWANGEAWDYYSALSEHTRIGLILYQRPNRLLSPEVVGRLAELPNVVGVKDGTGRVDLLQEHLAEVDADRFLYLNGGPTAELFAPAFRQHGVTSYSSALLNVIPEFATDFWNALARGDDTRMADLMTDVVLPFVAIRRRVPGYAVSLVKAGANLRGAGLGEARAPLPTPDPASMVDLKTLLDRHGWGGSLPGGYCGSPTGGHRSPSTLTGAS